MIVLLTVENIQDTQISSIDKVSSMLYQYKLVISTKYQEKEFDLKFSIISDFVELGDKSKQTSKNSLEIDSFPTKISSSPVYFKSTSVQELQVHSIEFTNFGDSFTFHWQPNLKNPGFIKPSATTLLGHVHFYPNLICIPFCYTGLEPPKHTPIIDRSSLFIENLGDISLNTDKSQIYDLWLKTFSLAPIKSVLNYYREPAGTTDVDAILFTFLKEHYLLLNQRTDTVISSMKLLLRQRSTQPNKLDHEFFSYRFPVEVNFEWPQVIKSHMIPVSFPFTQIYSNVHWKNVTIQNPSNSSVLFQVMLASNFSWCYDLYRFVRLAQSEVDIFYDHKYDYIMENLLKQEVLNLVFILFINYFIY